MKPSTKRNLLELFGPAILGGTGFTVVGWANSGFRPEVLRQILPVFVFAFVFTIVPSAFYLVILEAAFARGLNPRGGPALALSTFLGLLAGVAIGLTLSASGNRVDLSFLTLFAFTGIMVGFSLGLLLGLLPPPRATGREGVGEGELGWGLRLAWAGLVALPFFAWWAVRTQPGWIVMWTIAIAIFLAIKLLTLVDFGRREATMGRRLAYLLLWPGLDARAFLADGGNRPNRAAWAELGIAVAKLGLGLAAAGWALLHAFTAPVMVVGWVGMVGIIFTLHFGLLHIVSWVWRFAGFNAPAIMRAPIAADSLAQFWGGRWNRAFADVARRFFFRPTVRALGAAGAGLLVFLVSGLVHEVAISVPARGGWGGPTLYFLLQAGGIAFEKGAIGRRLGLSHGFCGWLWTLTCTAVPLPLLFHPAFVHHVIVPFFQALNPFVP